MDTVEGRRLTEYLYDYLQKPVHMAGLRRIFLISTRLHWGFADNHGDFNPMLQGLVYSGDLEEPDKGDLKVALTDEFESENREEYPAILVGIGDGGVAFDKSGVGNRSEEGVAGDSDTYTLKAKTSMVVSHRHRSSETAMIMAESTMSFYEGTRPSLMCSLGLQGMDITNMSKPMVVQNKGETVFKVDLTIGLSFNTAMTVNIESHRIKKWIAQLRPAI